MASHTVAPARFNLIQGYWIGVIRHAKNDKELVATVKKLLPNLTPSDWYWTTVEGGGIKFAFKSQADAINFFDVTAYLIF